MSRVLDEVLYGISINGQLPKMWSEQYPVEEEINFHCPSQCESMEIIEKRIAYFPIAKIK